MPKGKKPKIPQKGVMPSRRLLIKMNVRKGGLLESLKSVMSKKSKREKLAAVSLMHEEIRKLTWGFREAHGWHHTGHGWAKPPDYFAAISGRYKNVKVGKKLSEIIEFFSSPGAISAVRQRGRMRRKPRELAAEEIKALQTEMAVVLKWLFGKR